MAVTVDPDGPLVLAKRRLSDAVHALADPIPVWAGGTCRWGDPLYRRLRQTLSVWPTRRGAAQRSRLPCSVTALALLIDIDGTVAAWTPDEKGDTVVRLHTLTARGWRPQDAATIERHCDDLARWTVAATELLTPEAKVYLPMACPRCNAKHAYRDNSSGEHVRSRALKVSETGARCLACGSFWPPEQFGWLAQLLGCEALPA